MHTVDPAAVERFMLGQVACWNAHDKAGFLALYREMAPQRLEIEYVGRDEQADGWFVIEEMYDKHNHQITLDVVATIVNGNEAAVHHRNCIVGTDLAIESIETYRFEPGALYVRYFLKPPAPGALELDQFRGFAAAKEVSA
ncbi:MULTISPECIES: nuclear transport factor 2-like protein [Azohydromonas]|jgi:hypothetical protein|uniref:Nuclear transport factor 2 family protein n=1 Tax=Azohydromonas lata TaxID=45677 RepID=A0ABU5I7S9_9BURK|nr:MULTISPECIES: hypothetical protein [Azohydromonas]MDZ5455156.1 nuclear transport factor 2 family protein [Azohydromonas lata]